MIKVLIGAVMIAGGFYILMNTVLHGYRIKAEAFFPNCIFGIVVVIFGSLLWASALIG